jgi:hypothetical protein
MIENGAYSSRQSWRAWISYAMASKASMADVKCGASGLHGVDNMVDERLIWRTGRSALDCRSYLERRAVVGWRRWEKR